MNEIVMKENKALRSRWLTIRLTEDEEKKLVTLAGKTTAATVSGYARNVLLREPVTTLYRNQSADDFLAEMLLLKKELNAIGNNFNQAVHRLHTIDHYPQAKAWAERYEQVFHSLQQKTKEIHEKLQQIYQQWSLK